MSHEPSSREFVAEPLGVGLSRKCIANVDGVTHLASFLVPFWCFSGARSRTATFAALHHRVQGWLNGSRRKGKPATGDTFSKPSITFLELCRISEKKPSTYCSAQLAYEDHTDHCQPGRAMQPERAINH